MFATIEKTMNFAEFLTWDDDSGRNFELIDGYTTPIQDPNAKHQNLVQRLSNYLDTLFIDQDLPYVVRPFMQVRLLPNSLGRESSRKADIVVFALDEWEKMIHSSSSAAAYIPLPMVTEVISTNWKDDYMTKCREYEDLSIPEYWIIDYGVFGGIRFIGSPKQPTITIYNLLNGKYQPQQFRSDESLESQTFPVMVTAQQVFNLAKTR